MGFGEGGFGLGGALEPEESLPAQGPGDEPEESASLFAGGGEHLEGRLGVALPEPQVGEAQAQLVWVRPAVSRGSCPRGGGFLEQRRVTELRLVQKPLVVEAPAEDFGEPRPRQPDRRVFTKALPQLLGDPHRVRPPAPAGEEAKESEM